MCSFFAIISAITKFCFYEDAKYSICMFNFLLFFILCVKKVWKLKNIGSIHGIGVFATVDIKKGHVLFEYYGELIDQSEADIRDVFYIEKNYDIFLWTRNDGKVVDATNYDLPAKFLNNSCNENCVSFEDSRNRIWIETKRDIKIGEELTLHYGIDDKNITCLCNQINCRGYM